jgi:hypothetical protein
MSEFSTFKSPTKTVKSTTATDDDIIFEEVDNSPSISNRKRVANEGNISKSNNEVKKKNK